MDKPVQAKSTMARVIVRNANTHCDQPGHARLMAAGLAITAVFTCELGGCWQLARKRAMVAHNPASELPSLQGIVGTRLDKPPPTVIAFGPSRLKQPPTPSAWSSEPAGAVLWLASTQIIHREETTTSHHWLRSTPQSPFHPFSVEIFRSSIQLGPPSR